MKEMNGAIFDAADAMSAFRESPMLLNRADTFRLLAQRDAPGS